MKGVCVCVCVCLCTVGAEQGLKLSEQADGVELSEKSIVTETVPQFDNEPADQSGELQHTHTYLHEVIDKGRLFVLQHSSQLDYSLIYNWDQCFRRTSVSARPGLRGRPPRERGGKYILSLYKYYGFTYICTHTQFFD